MSVISLVVVRLISVLAVLIEHTFQNKALPFIMSSTPSPILQGTDKKKTKSKQCCFFSFLVLRLKRRYNALHK